MKFKRLRSKKLLACVVAVIAIVLAGILIGNKLSSPAEGTIDKTGSLSSDDYIAPTIKQYKGHYLSFNYPSQLAVSNSNLSGSYLEVVNLNSTDHSQVDVTIGVEPGTLASYTGVSFRKQRPNLYTETASSLDSVSFDSSQNGYEQDEFIEHNNLIASIVLTAPDQGSVGNDFNVIKSSLKWN